MPDHGKFIKVLAKLSKMWYDKKNQRETGGSIIWTTAKSA